jgi:4-hydroxyphenylpyruvate dioxygenase
VLGLSPGDSLELADPFGLIRSSGVANADRSAALRAERVAEPAHPHRSHRGFQRTGSGSVHHIAFELARTSLPRSPHMRANEHAPFVPISANYYDDLATRIDIAAPNCSSECATLGILFDRTAGGDYFHIYTESFRATGCSSRSSQRSGATTTRTAR